MGGWGEPGSLGQQNSFVCPVIKNRSGILSQGASAVKQKFLIVLIPRDRSPVLLLSDFVKLVLGYSVTQVDSIDSGS